MGRNMVSSTGSMEGNKVETVTQAIAGQDQDGDNQLDRNELRVLDPDFLRSIGMPDASATEMLLHFDKNNDKVLDQGERQAIVARVIPHLATAVDTVRKEQDFHRAKHLQDELVSLKASMQANFHEYLNNKQTAERSGLYNFQQYSLQKLNAEFAQKIRETEDHFEERRGALDRQFGMRKDVLSCSLEGTRAVGRALVPKPTLHTLDLRASLHHLSNQKRFGEAITLQGTIDRHEEDQLEAFGASQAAYFSSQHNALRAEYKAACERLHRKRMAAVAKVEEHHRKALARITNQNNIYKHRLEHCHTKSVQPATVVGARPVRVPCVPQLPNLHLAEVLGSSPERTRGADGAYQLTLPQIKRNSEGWRRPLHATSSYLVDPMWTRKGLAKTTPL